MFRLNKKLSVILFAFISASVAFSCKDAGTVKKETEKSKFYCITNPHTQSMMIIDKDGNTILRTTKPMEEFIQIIKDAETDEAVCFCKSITGEKKFTDSYEADGENYSYDYPSRREILYDLSGNELGFESTMNGGIDFALNNKLYFYNGDEKLVYDLITKEQTTLPYRDVNAYKDKIIISDSIWDKKIDDCTMKIYDKNLKHLKDIKGYAYEYISKMGKIELMRVITKNPKNKDTVLYNYIDDDLKLIFDEPIENNIYDEKSEIVTCKRNGEKFDFDFAKKKIVGKVEKDTTVEEPYDPDKWEKERKAIEEKFADIDDNAEWTEIEKFGKKLYYNITDKEYNRKDEFNLYDSDKNLLLENINNINPYIGDDYMLCDFEDGTRLYDKDFNVVKDFSPRHIETWSWTTHEMKAGTKRYWFTYLDDDTMTMVDKDYNPVIEKMKYIGYPEDDFLTYMDGFHYGLMDYDGMKLLSFSIFDDIKDENDRYDAEYEAYLDEGRKNRKADAYPRVDGSTANMPMMAEIRSSYLHEEKNISENNVKVTTTDYAWRNLLDGKNDLLLVYEPSAETKRIISKSDVKLRVTPIGVDALVFIANEKNPINNISSSDLRAIYSGKIVNWKSLGGDDKKIEAYQRPLNSGSQTLFLNLLMKNVDPVNAPKSYRMEGMDDLIEVLATYNNEGNSLGYSVYYYAKKMYDVPGLKLLSIDGVAPTDETISSNKYPFLNEYYLVIREDTPVDSETMKLYNFILSNEGKEAIKRAGYIPR